MAPIACRGPDHEGLSGKGITSVISYWPVSQRSHRHNANICLGETPTASYNHFDLCYSFNLLCDAEYGRQKGLHIAARNYIRNYAATAGPYGSWRIPYEWALWNLVVIMFLHAVDNFENTGALEGHWTLVIHECLSVAHKLGKFHRWQLRGLFEYIFRYKQTKVTSTRHPHQRGSGSHTSLQTEVSQP